MRSPHSSHAKPGRRLCFAAFVLATVAACALATTARALTLVVAPDGSGQFTSVQAGLDSLVHHRTSIAGSDTLIVQPGIYDEAVAIPSHALPYLYEFSFVVVCPAGPASTRVRSLDYSGLHDLAKHAWQIRGLAVAERVSAGWPYLGRLDWVACWFLGGFTTLPSGCVTNAEPSCFRDCSFFAATDLSGFEGTSDDYTFEGLHFHGAPARIRTGCSSDIRLHRCRFEGPADTLLVAGAQASLALRIESCAFSDAGCAIKVENGYNTDIVRADSCTFERIDGAAIALVPPEAPQPNDPGNIVVVRSSAFLAVGGAVRVVNGARVSVDVRGSEVIGTTGRALDIEAGAITVDSVHVSGAAGGVLSARLVSTSGAAGVRLTAIRAEHCGAGGIDVVDTSSVVPALVQRCLLRDAGGIAVFARRASILCNVVSEASGDGILMLPVSGAVGATLVANTVVGNAGDGIRIVGPWTNAPRVIQRNLAARNDGAGIRVGTPLIGSVAYNDAWQNYLGDYAQVGSPLDSNLVVDPRFCDLAAGDLQLQVGSPCGAGGVYGLIGALPEACASTVGAPAAGPLAFSLHPNPAHGAVVFTPPATGADGTIEVLDVAGRRVWSAPFRAGAPPIVWRGESSRGALDAGLYWARIVRPGETATRRLVWLR